MESYLYFGKKLGFEFFEPPESSPSLSSNLIAIVELDDYYIKILPESRIYGLHFVQEGVTIYAFLSIYEYSLDMMGRPGFHAFSFYYPFQVGAKRYNYIPQNLGETLERGLKRAEELKEMERTNVNPAEIKFDEFKKRYVPVKLTDEIRIINQPTTDVEGFFTNILLADAPDLFRKYYSTNNEGIIGSSSYPETDQPVGSRGVNTGIDHSLTEFWKTHEREEIKVESAGSPKSSEGISVTEKHTDKHDEVNDEFPYFISSWKYEKKSYSQISTEKGKPNYFKNKKRFASFLENAQTKGKSEYLVYLTREGMPPNNLFIAFGKLEEKANSNFFCITHTVRGNGSISVPDTESFWSFIQKVTSQLKKSKLEDIPDFRQDLQGIKLREYTQTKTRWYHFPVRHNIGYEAHFLIGKNPKDLKTVFEYFFLDSELETWEIIYQDIIDGQEKKERGKIRRKIDKDFKASKTNINYLDYLNGTTSDVKARKHFVGEEVDLSSEKTTAKENQNFNQEGKGKNRSRKSFLRDLFLEDKFTAILFAVAMVLFVVLIYFMITTLREDPLTQNPPKTEAPIKAPTQEEVEEQIKGLSLGDTQRKIILESTNYLNKIGKASRYKIHFKGEKGAKADLFPAGYSNKIYPWKKTDMDKHKGNLQIILTALEGREGIPEATLGQLQKIIDGLQAHQDQYFPKGFDRTKYEFKTISIDKAKSTVTLFQLGQDYGIPWKLLVEFNPGNIKLNGNHDTDGNPTADFNWENSKATKLIAYVPRNKK